MNDRRLPSGEYCGETFMPWRSTIGRDAPSPIDTAKIFVEYGATRVLECWGDDVPDGKQTDFRRAVQAKDDEVVVFSWIEWPDKATRDAGMKKAMDDPRMKPEANPMPFDGMRLIYGGFAPVVEVGTKH